MSYMKKQVCSMDTETMFSESYCQSKNWNTF